MSAFNVHVNRSPFDGIVKEIIHIPGKFFSAFKEKAYRENEYIKINLRNSLWKHSFKTGSRIYCKKSRLLGKKKEKVLKKDKDSE